MFKASTHLSARLEGIASHCLYSAYSDAQDQITSGNINPSQHEAVHVAHLSREIGNMAKSWRKELARISPSYKLSVSSVFTHQTPHVTWSRGGQSHRCELADLLVAVIDRSGSAPVGNAVLIQAKMSQGGSVQLSNRSERTQFELLSSRPVFDMQGKGQTPKCVDLTSYTPDSALIYGLATSNHILFSHRPYGWTFCSSTWLVEDQLSSLAGRQPPVTVNASACFSTTLVDLLHRVIGWKFDLPPAGKDWQHFTQPAQNHWSVLINYLLKETFARALSKAYAQGAARPIRGRDDALYLASTTQNGNRMFFFCDGLTDSHLSRYWANTDNGDEDWTESTSEMFFGGDDSDRPGQLDADEPGNGPISAIVIEIGTSEQ